MTSGLGWLFISACGTRSCDLRVMVQLSRLQFIQQLIELLSQMTTAQMSFWTWKVWTG